MTTRFKLIAAALGLVLAAGAIGDASAKTVTTTVTHGAYGKTLRTTRIVAHRPYRVHFGERIVRHIRIVHRAPARVVTLVGRPVAAPVVAVTRVRTPVVVARTVTRKIVRIARHPLLQRHAMFHRAGAKTTIIR